MKRLNMVAAVFIAVALVFGFAGCGKGAPDDVDHTTTTTPVTYKVPIPESMFYQGDTQLKFIFTATKDAKIYYAEKLYYATCSEVYAVHIVRDENGDETDRDMDSRKLFSRDDFADEHDCKADDFYTVEIYLRQYDPDGGTAAEFYIWAE